jgi:hypothetical protein
MPASHEAFRRRTTRPWTSAAAKAIVDRMNTATTANPVTTVNGHRSASLFSRSATRSVSASRPCRSSASSLPSDWPLAARVRTYEPLPWRVTTNPASRSTAIALLTVPGATSYSLLRTDKTGSCAPGARSPDSISARSASAICWYGGRESSGSSFPMSTTIPRANQVSSAITVLTLLTKLANVSLVAGIAALPRHTASSPGGVRAPAGAYIDNLGASDAG